MISIFEMLQKSWFLENIDQLLRLEMAKKRS